MAQPVPSPAAGMYTSGFAALRSITEFGGGANIVDATVAAARARIMLAILLLAVELPNLVREN
jgi:hypothetical protein